MILESIQRSFLIDQTKQDVEVGFINGAVIGGWVDLQDLQEIAEQYKRCADELVEKVSSNREFAYEYAYPIIFLYRHYLELRLKSISSNHKKKHAFDALLKNLLSNCEEQQVPVWLINSLKDRINEFKVIDNSGTRFRYGSPPKDEYLVDLSVMKLVIDDLDKVIEALEGSKK